jgi:hypothetical protein
MGVTSKVVLALASVLCVACQSFDSTSPGGPPLEPLAVATSGERQPPLPELTARDAVGEQKTIVVLAEFANVRPAFPSTTSAGACSGS